MKDEQKVSTYFAVNFAKCLKYLFYCTFMSLKYIIFKVRDHPVYVKHKDGKLYTKTVCRL